MKVKIREAIVVEGRYDKNTLAQTVDAPIITLGGFGVFNDREKLAFLRRLAEKRGLIVLTDSDGAGFVIRNYLKGALPGDRVKQAYIPDVRGKERRKRRPGREGKLGVEGMSPAVLLEVLRRAGATFEDAGPEKISGGQAAGPVGPEKAAEERAAGPAEPEKVSGEQAAGTAEAKKAEAKKLSKADLFALGLSGGTGSAVRRQALLKRLELPEHLNANGLLEALNLLYSREELEAALAELEEA